MLLTALHTIGINKTSPVAVFNWQLNRCATCIFNNIFVCIQKVDCNIYLCKIRYFVSGCRNQWKQVIYRSFPRTRIRRRINKRIVNCKRHFLRRRLLGRCSRWCLSRYRCWCRSRGRSRLLRWHRSRGRSRLLRWHRSRGRRWLLRWHRSRGRRWTCSCCHCRFPCWLFCRLFHRLRSFYRRGRIPRIYYRRFLCIHRWNNGSSCLFLNRNFARKFIHFPSCFYLRCHRSFPRFFGN